MCSIKNVKEKMTEEYSQNEKDSYCMHIRL